MGCFQDKEEPKEHKEVLGAQPSSSDGVNAQFYLGNSMPGGISIYDMHKWSRKGNFSKLERDHSYIQWLLPNKFQSQFNQEASPLSDKEVSEFRKNPDIIKNLLLSYEMMLEFYGIEFVDKKAGTFKRSEKYQERYQESFVMHTHNHMRIRRLLAHWNNVGFRLYAINFVDFLEKEIYGEVGNFEKGKTSSAPLQELVGVSNTFNIWRYYGNHKNDKKNIEKLVSFCFVQSLAEIEVKSKFFDADFKI